MSGSGMFRTAELGRTVSPTEFKQREQTLRQELLHEQRLLRKGREFPVLAVFAGVDGAGKGDTVNLLNAWMDPRWLHSNAYARPSDEERERPKFWKYWRDLPPRGLIGLFLSAWYSEPLLKRVYRQYGPARFDEALERIIAFERALTDDGALIIKFWMHLSHKEQARRLKTLSRDPLHGWRVRKRDWQHWKIYDHFIQAAERLIMRTSTGPARWHIIEGGDPAYRALAVGGLLRDAIRRHREQQSQQVTTPVNNHATSTPVALSRENTVTLLDHLDLDKRLSKRKYAKQLVHYQGQLNRLQRKAMRRCVPCVLVFEGADAAGKGGTIRRLISALDIRHVSVIPIAAPTDEENQRHYLWRFWRQLPRLGRMVIFDRSWYGRVLVERVEGYAAEPEWRRAYAEINDFESQLAESGTMVLKFWMHIDQDEQEKRFNARKQTPHKSWKLTEEDWRNRERWHDYCIAVHDMVEQTGTHVAPWIIVEGNNKRHARIKVLRKVCQHLKRHLQN